MRNLLALTGIIALLIVGRSIFTGDKKLPSIILNLPDLALISSRQETHLFADTDYYDTFRNEGAAGQILLVVSQPGKQWKLLLHYDQGEQREIHYSLPGILDGAGTTQLNWKPACLATSSELGGALAPQ